MLSLSEKLSEVESSEEANGAFSSAGINAGTIDRPINYE